MKLALHILRKGLISLWLHRLSLCGSGFVLIALIVVAEISFPYRGSINNDGDLLLWNGWEITAALLIVSILLGFAFVVQAHRHVLCPNAVNAGPLGMRFGPTEVKFILYGFAMWAASFLGFMLIFSPTLFGFHNIDVIVKLEEAMFGAPVVEIFARVLAVFLVARFVLCLPGIVARVDRPLRSAWRLSEGRLLTVVTIIATPMIAGDFFVGPLIALANDLVPLTWNGINIFHFILRYFAGFFFTAYAAMLLSHIYLELTRAHSEIATPSIA